MQHTASLGWLPKSCFWVREEEFRNRIHFHSQVRHSVLIVDTITSALHKYGVLTLTCSGLGLQLCCLTYLLQTWNLPIGSSCEKGRINFRAKGVWESCGEGWLIGSVSLRTCIRLAPTSPSLDSNLSSVLQVASILPASALISTPLGASITRDRVGDSNLKYPQDED